MGGRGGIGRATAGREWEQVRSTGAWTFPGATGRRREMDTLPRTLPAVKMGNVPGGDER